LGAGGEKEHEDLKAEWNFIANTTPERAGNVN